jgi:epoxyqueuosine reductase
LTTSRYCKPDQDDYHYRLKILCKEIIMLMKEYDSGCATRICVDSAPVLERGFAYSSGMGFIGKNNMLIIPGYGSYFYLAEIFTSIPLDVPPVQAMDNQCGSCNLCLDACPTGALEMPFSINASLCLSYLTIESKSKVGPGEGMKMENCFFGCDRCQGACPFNGHKDSREVLLPPSEEILEMQGEEFDRRFGKTSFKRAGLEKIKENIRAINASGVRGEA